MRKSRGRTIRGLGSRLLKLRLHLQYSREKMANKLGVHPNTVSRYESGDIIPGFLCLSRLQKDWDVSMDWLLFKRGPMFFPEKGPDKEAAAPPAEELRPEIKELVTCMEQDPVLLHEIMLFFHKAGTAPQRIETAQSAEMARRAFLAPPRSGAGGKVSGNSK